MEHPFTWFSIVPFLKNLPAHVASTLFVVALLTVISWLVNKVLKRSEEALVPRTGLVNFIESIIEWLLNLMEGVIGHGAEKYLPLIGSIFLFILTSNLLGLIPGFSPPTIDVNTNAACAIVVLLSYNYYGFKENGIGYLKHFIGPVWWLFILYLPIELFSHMFRPITLSIRLFGNIFGDHSVLEIFTGLVPYGVPVFFLGLGLIVSVVQAFVFTLLSTIYIGLAVSHEH
ncbi:MAG: F0F1 ATP synthase subunit A [Candidatus Tectomicrobia bacterium]|nr:F0F1 ATP synthase subunit A [Candidatus Tectomicrobia bacterium]